MPTKKIEAKPKAVRKPTVRRRKAQTLAPTRAPTHEQIAERAYFLSLEGSADALANWLRAERELLAA